MRELEASRRLQDDLQRLIDAHRGTVPSAAAAEAFERAGSQLPEGSELLRKLHSLAQGLRDRPARYIGEDSVRRVIGNLRRQSDLLGAGIEGRDRKLRERR